MRVLLFFVFGLHLSLTASSQVEPRVYSFTNTPPAVVEQTLRRYIPEPHRIKMNADRKQVMVIATTAEHNEITKVMTRVDRPTAQIDLWTRVAGHSESYRLQDGEILALPLTMQPDQTLIQHARHKLPEPLVDAPPHGSALEIQASILKESPLAIRLRITPVLVFGPNPPHTAVRYTEYSTDLLIRENLYLSLENQLGVQELFRPFFRQQISDARPPEPFDVLLALEGLHYSVTTPDTL